MLYSSLHKTLIIVNQLLELKTVIDITFSLFISATYFISLI